VRRGDAVFGARGGHADEFQRAFAQCDVIAGPVTTSVAFGFGEKAADPVSMYLADLYTVAILNSDGNPPPGQGDAPDWFMDSLGTALSFGNVGMALFVGWMLLTRLAGVGVSMEGKNYWLLKVSPLRVEDLLLAKFLMAYLPSIALGAVFRGASRSSYRLTVSTKLAIITSTRVKPRGRNDE